MAKCAATPRPSTSASSSSRRGSAGAGPRGSGLESAVQRWAEEKNRLLRQRRQQKPVPTQIRELANL
eukprot:8751669-Lingulodinium_polyedra.AAC.1